MAGAGPGGRKSARQPGGDRFAPALSTGSIVASARPPTSCYSAPRASELRRQGRAQSASVCLGDYSPGGLRAPNSIEGVHVPTALNPSYTRRRAVDSCPAGACSPCSVSPTLCTCPCPSLVLGTSSCVGGIVRSACSFTSCACVLYVQLPVGYLAERPLLVVVTARAGTVMVGIATLLPLLSLRFTHHSTYHVPQPLVRTYTDVYSYIYGAFLAAVTKMSTFFAAIARPRRLATRASSGPRPVEYNVHRGRQVGRTPSTACASATGATVPTHTYSLCFTVPAEACWSIGRRDCLDTHGDTTKRRRHHTT